MAHEKAGGSARNGRDSEAKHLGVKRLGGESVLTGSIIVRQHGTKFHAGTSIGCGRDHTLFAKTGGKVRFKVKGPKNRKSINIEVEQVFHVPVTDESSATHCGTFYTR